MQQKVLRPPSPGRRFGHPNPFRIRGDKVFPGHLWVGERLSQSFGATWFSYEFIILECSESCWFLASRIGFCIMGYVLPKPSARNSGYIGRWRINLGDDLGPTEKNHWSIHWEPILPMEFRLKLQLSFDGPDGPESQEVPSVRRPGSLLEGIFFEFKKTVRCEWLQKKRLSRNHISRR